MGFDGRGVAEVGEQRAGHIAESHSQPRVVTASRVTPSCVDDGDRLQVITSLLHSTDLIDAEGMRVGIDDELAGSSPRLATRTLACALFPSFRAHTLRRNSSSTNSSLSSSSGTPLGDRNKGNLKPAPLMIARLISSTRV